MQTSSRSKEDLTKLIVKLGSFAQAILLAQLQFSYLQRLKIRALKLSKCYHAKAHLDKYAKNELFRWIENLRLYNGKSLILPPTDLCISTDVGGGTCQGILTAGLWSQEERKVHFNILELKAVHLAILTFTKFKIVYRMHVQMDNKVALSLLVKMGGTHNKEILGLSKQICDYLQSKKILITAEYLPVHLNVTVDQEFLQFSGQEQLETLPGSICKNLTEIRYSPTFLHPGCIINSQSTWSESHIREVRQPVPCIKHRQKYSHMPSPHSV